MKIINHQCPSCGANLDIKISDETNNFYCLYCGSVLSAEKDEIKISINTTINDTAEIIRAKTEEYEQKNSFKHFISVFVLILAVIFAIFGFFNHNKKVALQEGKINAGNCSELIGKDYRTVEAHFKSAGFTDIELIDLNDSIFNEGEVETISIGGDTEFESVDWFYSDTKVVISYH